MGGEGSAGRQSTGWLRRMSTCSGGDVGAAPESVGKYPPWTVVTLAVTMSYTHWDYTSIRISIKDKGSKVFYFHL